MADPMPVIIDCDPGTDDALALLLAFASPDKLDVRAVTVAGGNARLDNTLANARGLVTLAGVPVPVHAGADRPLSGAFYPQPRIHGDNGLGGCNSRLPPRPSPRLRRTPSAASCAGRIDR